MPFPVDTKFIERAAQRLGISLPESFVVHIERSNGGNFEVSDDTWQLFPIFDDSDKTRIKRTCNDIVYETKVARQWPGFPQEAVAIASNGSGDKLVFLPNESGERLSEVVYHWDHETGEMTNISPSFGKLQYK